MTLVQVLDLSIKSEGVLSVQLGVLDKISALLGRSPPTLSQLQHAGALVLKFEALPALYADINRRTAEQLRDIIQRCYAAGEQHDREPPARKQQSRKRV